MPKAPEPNVTEALLGRTSTELFLTRQKLAEMEALSAEQARLIEEMKVEIANPTPKSADEGAA